LEEKSLTVDPSEASNLSHPHETHYSILIAYAIMNLKLQNRVGVVVRIGIGATFGFRVGNTKKEV